MTLSYREVAEIIKLIDASTCEELVLELGDTKLVLRRHGAGPTQTIGDAPGNPPDVAPAATPPSPAPSGAGADGPNLTAAAPRPDGMTEVRSPMVGTFYRASSPEAPPFVEPGVVVAAGEPLCLIEVMKLYTTITAQRPGRIVEICADNGAMVEYGQTLFVLEPV
jgi:acetyl-CoA carboxylase biotin carboxyl carrier protein